MWFQSCTKIRRETLNALLFVTQLLPSSFFAARFNILIWACISRDSVRDRGNKSACSDVCRDHKEWEEILTRCNRCCMDPRACGDPAARCPGSAARSGVRRSAMPRRGSGTRTCEGRVSSSRSSARVTGTAAFSSSFPSPPSRRARRPKPSSARDPGGYRRIDPSCVLSRLSPESRESGEQRTSSNSRLVASRVSQRRRRRPDVTRTQAEETHDHSTFDRIKLKPHETCLPQTAVSSPRASLKRARDSINRVKL